MNYNLEANFKKQYMVKHGLEMVIGQRQPSTIGRLNNECQFNKRMYEVKQRYLSRYGK